MIEIIPAIDIINGKCVRLTEGDYNRKTIYDDDPVRMARSFEAAGYRKLHVVDLDGASLGRPVNNEIISRICRETSLEVDCGGGIRTRNDVALMLDAGVKKITAGSVAALNRDLVLEWVSEFGAERIILGADVKNGMIAVRGWKETVQTGLLDFIASYLSTGINTVICTDVSRDGTMSGPAIDLYRTILEAFPGINLIASGGVGSMNDITALDEAGVRQVIVGKAIYEKGSGLQATGNRQNSTGHRAQSSALSSRIIPCLDVKDGRVVKGVNFESLRDAGDPVELAKYYSDQGADELVFLDISATDENRKTMAEMVRRVSEAVNIPFTVGGGIRSVDDVSLLLSCGADKVSVNSAAVRKPEIISQMAARFGNQCIVLAVDAGQQPDGSWKVFINGGKVATELDLFDWVVKGVGLGAGEILFTSIDNDGTGKGFAIEPLAKISTLVNVPVIASGGAGTMEHFADAVKSGRASAVLAAGLFHYGKMTIPDLKRYLSGNGICVRR